MRPAIAAPELRDDLLTLRSKFPPQAIGKRMTAPLASRKTKISWRLSKVMLHSCLQNGNLTRLVLSARQLSKGRRAIPARQSRAASCYTTASSAAALDHRTFYGDTVAGITSWLDARGG
jgi:hypothetical protein